MLKYLLLKKKTIDDIKTEITETVDILIEQVHFNNSFRYENTCAKWVHRLLISKLQKRECLAMLNLNQFITGNQRAISTVSFSRPIYTKVG